ncbi:MAG: metalloregulator ArsR/SmtB family transcription factor [Alphaproteobacteria bacterium]|nr:metalloregulator ArsR/SmtB family transcription factor [Alphaproteobacteria bacterium]
MKLSKDQTIEIAETFRLMGDPTRLAILVECLDGPVAVGDLVARTGASQSLVSHHLRLLRAARILTARREGKNVYYAAMDEHIRTVVGDMIDHVAEPADEGLG